MEIFLMPSGTGNGSFGSFERAFVMTVFQIPEAEV